MGKYAFDFDAAKTALVVVDMQNDFVRVGGGMEVIDTRSTLPCIAKLIAFARKNKMPVIYTKFVTGPCKMLLWTWSPQIPQDNTCRRGFKRFYPDVDKELDCSDIVEEIYPQDGDYVFEKYGYSSFHNSPLADILASEGRDSIIVVGTVTQICVEDTVHAAFHQGIHAIVASDGCSSFVPHLHDAALENFHMKYGVVDTAENIMKEFEGKA